MHGDPAATSGAPSDPIAMKTRPLSAETSTGILSGENGKGAQSPNQQAGPERREGRALTFGEKAWRGGKEAREERQMWPGC